MSSLQRDFLFLGGDGAVLGQLQTLLKTLYPQEAVLHTARTIEEAVPMTYRIPFELVFIDLDTRSGLGPDHLATFHVRAPVYPIVALVSRQESAMGDQCLSSGAQEWLPRDALDADNVHRAVRAASRIFQLQDALREMALIDTQTGLYNATGFQTLVQSHMAKLARAGKPSLLISVRVSNLDEIDQARGGHERTNALIHTARVLGGSFRATDIAAHLSMGDFAVFAPEADSHHADLIIDRCRTRMARLEKSERWPFHLRLDYGYAQIRPDHPETLEHILQRARVMNVG